MHAFVSNSLKVIVSFLTTVCLASGISAQTGVQDSLLHYFNKHREDAVQEKLYLHTDKNFYMAGEICWMKVYYVDAFFHRPLDISKLAYIEILDAGNNPVLQTKLALNKGNGNGSLSLPVKLLSGKYKLRAYTSWMKNFGAAYFFEKTITILNTGTNETAATPSVDPKYDIQFLPEGGNLVNGIQSKVAFRVVDEAGKGVNTNGVIINEKNDTLVKFAAGHFGIGNFLLIPEEGQNYKAVISLPGGVKMFVPLPARYSKGYVMQLLELPSNQLKITVKASGNNAAFPQVYLFIHTRNSLKYFTPGNIQNGMAEFSIDRNKLGDGISHFTIFNADGKPVCERLYFKYPEKELQIDLGADSTSYATRKKIRLFISTTDKNGKAEKANMSMAVYRIDSLQGIDDMDISNYLWLSADLTGTIESPQYYFTSVSKDVQEAMDNLMLTHGWRRFNWDDIITHKSKTYEFLPEFAGHIVTGKVMETGTGLPAKNIFAYFGVPDKRAQFHSSQSGDNGQVKFDIPDFYNNGEIIVQTNSQHDSLYRVEINNPFADSYSDKFLPSLSVEPFPRNDLLNHHIGAQVQSAFMDNTFNRYSNITDTTSFFQKPDFTYLLDNYVRFTTMEEVLREYVREVQVSKSRGKYQLTVYDLQKQGFFAENPLVLIDGIPVFDYHKVMQYNPLNVRKLEVVCKQYHLENNFYNGIVNLVTYNGNLNDFILDPHSTVLDYEGLQLQREFFSPVYELKAQYESRLPDFRNVLYWSPTVETTEKGKVEVSFYSSDIPGKYAVVIQGLSPNGQTGSKVEAFYVR